VPADGKSDAVAVLRGAAAALDASKANAMIRNRFGSELADLFRRAGDRAAARDRLAKAKAAADTTGESTAQGKYAEWRWLARVYAKLGDADMVLKLADAAPDKDPWSARDQVLLDATGAAAGVGETAAVARLAEASSHPEVRTWSAASTRQLAVTRLARTDLPAALRAVDSVADPGDRVCALAGSVVLNLWGTDLRDERWWPGGAMETFGVARTRKKFGDPAGGRDALARAVALLPTVSAEQRPRADLGVIHSAAILGDLPTCRRLVAALPPQKLTDAQKRQRVDGLAEAKAKGYLAAAETAAGNDAAGLKLVDGLATTDQKENVLLAVAIARWHAGRRESAVDVFEQVARLWVAESYPQVQNLIDARGRVGDIAGAKRVAADALARLVADRKKSGHYHGDDAWHREQVARSVRWWETIAFHQFRHGDIDGARATAAEYLKSDMWAGEAAGRVAEQQARTGKAADARKEADAEPDPLRRAYMLAGLARGLLGDPD
jgi:tetratricopeptide (TPR) repeat protein